MAHLIAIGYPDETTADAAAAEARRLAQDLIIQPDAIAVIGGGRRATTTSTPPTRGRRRSGLGHVLGVLVRPTALHPGLRHGAEDLAVQAGQQELQEALHGERTAAG